MIIIISITTTHVTHNTAHTTDYNAPDPHHSIISTTYTNNSNSNFTPLNTTYHPITSHTIIPCAGTFPYDGIGTSIHTIVSDSNSNVARGSNNEDSII